MSQCFRYFGEKLFGKFDFVKSDETVFPSEELDNATFHSLLVGNESLLVQDVYLSWSFALYLVDGRIFYCGFEGTEVTGSPVLLPFEDNCDLAAEDLKISGCNNSALLAKEGLCFFILCSDKLLMHQIDVSLMKEKIKQVVCTESHNIFVDCGGAVYCSKSATEPIVQLSFAHKVKEVACGKEHTLFLTSSGSIYSYGSGSRGQLGHGNIQKHDEPTLIEALDGIYVISIAAGGWHSAAVSECNDLYTWGWNESGQLGRPCKQLSSDNKDFEEICFFPKIVEIEGDLAVQSVSLGSRHSAVLLSDSSVWTWGWNEYGQLGCNTRPCCDVPQQISFPDGFVPNRFSCSSWGTLIVSSYIDNKACH